MSPYDQQRFPAGASNAPPAYHTQQLPGQGPMSNVNSAFHPSSYANQYAAGASGQGYGQMQSTQRQYSAGPSPTQQSFQNAAYFPDQQQQYLYYAGQYAHPNQLNYSTSYSPGLSQSYGQTGGDLGGRGLHSGYSPGAPTQYQYSNSGQYLRPSLPGKYPVLRMRGYD